jgi:hypothetical protein
MSSAAKVWVLLGLGLAGLLILTRRRKKKGINKQDFGAFMERFQLFPPPQPVPPIARHVLTDLTFAVGDTYASVLPSAFGFIDESFHLTSCLLCIFFRAL